MTGADPTVILVPGDRAEQETRQSFAQAMDLALDAARELAAGAENGERFGSRVEPSSATFTAWSRHAAHTSVEDALAVGWLVAAGGHPPPGEPAGGSHDASLDGLDVAVKDIIDVAGLPVRNGTPGGLWRVPETSAAAWRALAAAGARCVGKAATHEMAWGVTTPQIPHPTRHNRVPGGSSGGSAACVAAGVTQGALGTDTGGSVRIPAALCGVVGFRPTTGSVDMSGITPLAPSQDVVGPLAKDVGTCTAMLEVLLGRPLGIRPEQGVAALRVGVLGSPGRLDDETATAYAATLERLPALGVEVVHADTDVVRSAGHVSLLTMLEESAALYADTVRAAPTGFGGEARALLTLGERLTEHAHVLSRARQAVTAQTAGLYRSLDLDAFLTPTTACVAPLRGARTVSIGGRAVPVTAALARFTAWAAVAGLPAVSVPAPVTGLPVGIQVMAPPHREDVCAALAAALETPTPR